jgi:CRISPR system Cascade subunit CasC
MFVELHFIQHFAPANLNRDDANLPKDCDFGGVRRARISSQCFKRAIRTDPIFSATTEVANGTRTRYIVRALRQRLTDADKAKEDATAVATAFANAYSGGMDAKRPDQTKVMLYLSSQEVDWVAEQLLAKWDELLAAANSNSDGAAEADKKKGRKSKAAAANPASDIAEELVKQTKERTSAPDIALFGRMLADRPETNIDAACQVAHAISTHAVKMDIDYFTAMEELADPHETGASQIGTTGFNSACFYRYLRLDYAKLLENLKDDGDLARKIVKGLMLAAEAAIPTGKQNSHAAHNRPNFLLAVARMPNSAGWSLANAFEKPVRAQRDSGLVGPSIERLDRYWNNLCRFYGEDSVKVKAAAFGADLAADEVALSDSLKGALVPALGDWVGRMLAALP